MPSLARHLVASDIPNASVSGSFRFSNTPHPHRYRSRADRDDPIYLNHPKVGRAVPGASPCGFRYPKRLRFGKSPVFEHPTSASLPLAGGSRR
ncbi:MAG: hypothetical protein O2964_17180, partial [Verrucomicrobia bacterium]|nr:hypothetical protein [Verrucomicrobiota bacterium]